MRVIGVTYHLAYVLLCLSFATVSARAASPNGSTYSVALDLFSTTTARGDERLGDMLLPLGSNVELEGTIVALDDTPGINSESLTFSFDDFRGNAASLGRNNDGDLIFYVRLDEKYQKKLKHTALASRAFARRYAGMTSWPQFDYSVIHVEAVAYARNGAKSAALIFPGWRESAVDNAVSFDGTAIGPRLTCANYGEDSHSSHRYCTQPLIDGQPLVGRHVRVKGALVIDCNDFGARTGCGGAGAELELHPAISIVETPN